MPFILFVPFIIIIHIMFLLAHLYSRLAVYPIGTGEGIDMHY